MKRGSSWLPRLTAKQPGQLHRLDLLFVPNFHRQAAPAAMRWACAPRNRAVATEGGSLTRSRARNTPGAVVCAVSTAFCSAVVFFRPERNNVSDLSFRRRVCSSSDIC